MPINLKKVINDFKVNGKLFGYGASARSSTSLNYLNYQIIILNYYRQK